MATEWTIRHTGTDIREMSGMGENTTDALYHHEGIAGHDIQTVI
jgi:hypothetical protein